LHHAAVQVRELVLLGTPDLMQQVLRHDLEVAHDPLLGRGDLLVDPLVHHRFKFSGRELARVAEPLRRHLHPVGLQDGPPVGPILVV
jgi:hypothetical protein